MITEEQIVRPQVEIGGAFALTDHLGQSVSEKSWPGRYLLIFFGFTHCKVICPRALSKLEQVLDLLAAEEARLRPLYITVDPARDTPARMREFLRQYPHFLGLTGEAAQIEGVKSAYRVFVRRAASADGDYDMPHTALTYLVAPDGKLAAHFVDALDAPTMVERIRTCLAQA